jgi:Homeodomain
MFICTDSASDGNSSSYDNNGHHMSRRALFPVSTVATVTDAKCFRSCRKRRKTRTAFTNQQIAELERWFGRQKYLTPADRDEIAAALRLSAAQVITWFQNRRAKLKRDLEELKADVAAAKALGTEPSTAVLDRLAELTRASGLQQQQPGSAPGDVNSTTMTPVAKKTDVGGRTLVDGLGC